MQLQHVNMTSYTRLIIQSLFDKIQYTICIIPVGQIHTYVFIIMNNKYIILLITCMYVVIWLIITTHGYLTILSNLHAYSRSTTALHKNKVNVIILLATYHHG